MSTSLVQSAHNAGLEAANAGVTVTFGSPPSVGNLLLFFTASDELNGAAPSGYTLDKYFTATGSDVAVDFQYAPSSPGTAYTPYNNTLATNYQVSCGIELSGMATSGGAGFAQTADITASSNLWTGASITTGATASIFAVFAYQDNAGLTSFSPSSGFSMLGPFTAAGSGNTNNPTRIVVLYQLNAAAGTYTPKVTTAGTPSESSNCSVITTAVLEGTGGPTLQTGAASSTLSAKPKLVVSATFKATSAVSAKPIAKGLVSFAATSAASAKAFGAARSIGAAASATAGRTGLLAKSVLAATSAAGARLAAFGALTSAATSAASAKTSTIAASRSAANANASAKWPTASASAKLTATSAASAKPKFLASSTQKQTSAASAKSLALGKAIGAATSAASARETLAARSNSHAATAATAKPTFLAKTVTKATSASGAMVRLLAAFVSSGSSAASAAFKGFASLTARVTSVVTAIGSWGALGGPTLRTFTASIVTTATPKYLVSAAWRATSAVSARIAVGAKATFALTATASAKVARTVDAIASATSAASAKVSARMTAVWRATSAASAKALESPSIVARSTSTVSSRFGALSEALGRATSAASAKLGARVNFAARVSSLVQAAGSWNSLGGNITRTFTATVAASANPRMIASLAMKAVSSLAARLAIRATSVTVAKSAATGRITGFFVRLAIAATSTLQAHGNWYPLAGVTLRTFTASVVTSAKLLPLALFAVSKATSAASARIGFHVTIAERATTSLAAVFSPLIRIVRKAVSAIASLGYWVANGYQPSGAGATIEAPLQIGLTIAEPATIALTLLESLEIGITVAEPATIAATIAAPLVRTVTLDLLGGLS